MFWDGIPNRGASWLREAPIETTWARVVLVPAFGGAAVSVLNLLRSRFDSSLQQDPFLRTPSAYLKSASRPLLKAVAASVTLGTGNSLGPEGPSVDIGTSIAKGLAPFFHNGKTSGRMLSLLAAGSAAGLAAGIYFACYAVAFTNVITFLGVTLFSFVIYISYQVLMLLLPVAFLLSSLSCGHRLQTHLYHLQIILPWSYSVLS